MKKSAYRNKNCLKHLLTWEKLPTFAKHKGNGGLAQLGERVLCKHEVIGSSPIFSTATGWGDLS